MKTSLLHKDGIELLVEETMITDQETENFLDAKKLTLSKIPGGENKEYIIELRNDNVIREIEHENEAIGLIMKQIGLNAFSKSISFENAIREVFKINLVLNKEYSFKDVFIGAKIRKNSEEEKSSLLMVDFEKINFEIIEKYKDTVSKYITYCHECLFGDLYDKEVLVKYLPIVYFLLSISDR